MVLMQENAVYSVLSPEGFAAILWKDAGRAEEASGVMKLTAPDLRRLGVIDGIIAEPPAGPIPTRPPPSPPWTGP